jgi:heterotetrameric sarcosine oxidase delta subunit
VGDCAITPQTQSQKSFLLLFSKKEAFLPMRLPCPHCGERRLAEFAYHGDATVKRPTDPEAFTDYVYLRDNPDGAHCELWYHAAGCHAWLVVTRDLRSHEILSAAPARTP